MKVKVLQAINELDKRNIDREELTRLIILALFSKSEIFLIGERGTSKSRIIRQLSSLIEKSKYWELLVGIDTKKYEIFGKEKIAENGTVYYDAKNTVLDAHIAFLDEMFKARTEILNHLLQIMADRYYTTGDGRIIDVPLITLVGASNEYPTGSLAAPFLDRLTFWFKVKRVGDIDKRKKLFRKDFVNEPIEPIFTLEEINRVYENAKKIYLPDEILENFTSLTGAIINKGVKTSDRKFLKIVDVMRVSAFLNGRDYVNHSDLLVLLHTAWHNESEKGWIEEIVFEYLFSTRTNVENRLNEIKKELDEAEHDRNTKLYDFLEYKMEFKSATVRFNKYIKICRDFRDYVLKNILLKIKDLQLLKSNIEEIERMIEENIFFPNYKSSTFDEKILRKLSRFETIVNLHIKKLSEFLSKNESITDYNRNKTIKGA